VHAKPFPNWFGSSKATWSSSRRMIENSLCRPWSEDSRYRLIHSLSVLWSECLCYQSPEFLFLMSLPAMISCMTSLGRDPREKTSPTPRSISVLLLLPIFSKDCCDKPLAWSSSEWAYSQQSHPSLCHRDADSFFTVQPHLAHYARGSRWEEHESVFWVFDHSNLPSGRDRYFKLGALLMDPRSP
jgi:hypothetical protein